MSSPAEIVQKKEALLKDWHTGLRLLQIGNFRASSYYAKVGKRFGIPVVITTTIVSSAIFASLGESDHKVLQLIAGFVSILSTILSSLQTFLGYSERSSSHKEAAAGYGELRTEVQVLLSLDLVAVTNLDARIEGIRTRWNALDKGSPPLPDWVRAEASKTAEAEAAAMV